MSLAAQVAGGGLSVAARLGFAGLAAIGEDLEAPYVRRAARWLLTRQNDDGGWGESIASYDHPGQKGVGPSTPSQTAWALMGLIAAGEIASPAVYQFRGDELYVRARVLESNGRLAWTQPVWKGR